MSDLGSLSRHHSGLRSVITCRFDGDSLQRTIHKRTVHQNDWPQWLALAQFAYNHSHNATIGCTSFRLVYQYRPEIRRQIDGESTAEREGNSLAGTAV